MAFIQQVEATNLNYGFMAFNYGTTFAPHDGSTRGADSTNSSRVANPIEEFATLFGRYKCPYCHYLGKEKFLVRRHIMYKHTGEKPFKCAVCSKPFTEKGDLRKHTRVHTGERPYQCPWCKKAFSQNHSLKSHMKVVCRANVASKPK